MMPFLPPRMLVFALVFSCLFGVGKRPTDLLAQSPSRERQLVQPKRDASRLMPIKVMSFNIRYGLGKDGDNRWDKRSYLVKETIEVFGPDLLGTQEVLKFQADFLKESFPDFGFHGVGRDDGQARGEFVPVMYRKDRFSLTDAGHFWLSEQPDVAGSKSWDSSLPRMASWVELSDKKNENAKFIFLNTHFDHRGKQARLESAKLIRRKADVFLNKGLPVILVGDFNTTEDGNPYAALTLGLDKAQDEPQPNRDLKNQQPLTTSPLVDSYRAAHVKRNPDESTFSRWDGYRKGSRIDWIIHSKQFSTLHSIINHTNDDGRYPSDHYPVQSVVRLRELK